MEDAGNAMVDFSSGMEDNLPY